MQHVKRLAKKKSVIGGCLALAVTGTVFGYERNAQVAPPQYVLAAVARETLIVSVNGSGQVSGLNQLDIKPVVSGAITKVLVKPGQAVKTGAPLFEIDRKNALKTVRDAALAMNDAAVSVQSAQLSLDKLKQPTDAVSLVQAQNNLNQAKRDLEKLQAGPSVYDLQSAEADLNNLKENIQLSSDGKNPNLIRNAYDNAVATLKTTAQTLQQSLYDADAVLGIDNAMANDSYERVLSVLDSGKLANANALYPGVKLAVAAFKKEADTLATSGADTADIDKDIVDAQESLGLMDPLLRNTYDALLATVPSIGFSQGSLSSLQNTIQSDRTSVASKLAALVSQTQALASAKSSYETALLNVQKSQASLDKLKEGADPLDIASAQDRVHAAEQSLTKLQQGTDPIDLAQSQNALSQRRSSLAQARSKWSDAKEALNDYTVRAPFDGVVARIAVQPADQASGGTVLATLLTEAKMATMSLNEVDASKVHAGQKATLTFDAVPDLRIAGTVSDIDPLGTVTQGVVNYAIKIIFETQDDRVKPGMSVSAAIVADMKTDVLAVPNAALQSVGGSSAVQILASAKAGSDLSQPITSAIPPELHVVQTGLANDSLTEITGGLNEGDLIVTRTIDPSKAKAATTSAASGARIPGLGGLGGGATFVGGGGGGRNVMIRGN